MFITLLLLEIRTGISPVLVVQTKTHLTLESTVQFIHELQ